MEGLHAVRERSDKEVGSGSIGFPDPTTFDCASVELFFFKHETWAERGWGGGRKTCIRFLCRRFVSSNDIRTEGSTHRVSQPCRSERNSNARYLQPLLSVPSTRR